MIRITARIFDEHNLIGYSVTDGNVNYNITKLEAWNLAKNKMIENVQAVGTEADPGLSGTNGFELKSLPKVDYKIKARGITWQDKEAAYLRKMLKVGYFEADNDCIRKITNEAFESGEMTNENVGSLRDHIEIVCGLKDSLAKKDSIIMVPGALLEGKNPMQSTQSIIGYTIKNIGNTPIEITRLTITPDHAVEKVVLNPGATINLSRAELALLGSRPEFGLRFINGRVYAKYKEQLDMYNILKSHFFTFDEETGKRISYTTSDLRQLESTETIYKYFQTKENVPDAIGKQPSKSPQTTKQTREKLQSQGVFNGFKR